MNGRTEPNQVNSLSSKDLKDLFRLYEGTPSDTHDKLRCKRYCRAYFQMMYYINIVP